MKVHRHGQAAILSDVDYMKILKELMNAKHRLLIQIARYTGERWGAIVQMRVSDAYSPDGVPRSTLTFRAKTRKASPDGTHSTRQIPTHPQLIVELKAYRPTESEWLFPSLDSNKHLSFDAADDFWRKLLVRVGLSGRGISTHSTRRTMISRLANAGTSAPLIKAITGHKDLRTIQRYIEIDDDRVKAAIALL